MAKNEGLSSFFKGLVPKVSTSSIYSFLSTLREAVFTDKYDQLLMTGPKLVFSFWLAQTLIPAFDKAFAR